MNVYVESNFVLELALQQAQSESCQALVDYAANNQIGRKCRLLTDFDGGLNYVTSHLASA